MEAGAGVGRGRAVFGGVGAGAVGAEGAGGVHETTELRIGVGAAGRGFVATRRGAAGRTGEGAGAATWITVIASGVRAAIKPGRIPAPPR